MINNKYVKILIVAIIILLACVLFVIKKVNNKENVNVDIYSDVVVSENKKITKMINFVAEGCRPCKQMQVLIKELKEEYKGNVEILELDVYKYSELANKYNIMYTPTQIFLDANGNVAEQNKGFLAKIKIKEIIEKYNGENENGNIK